MHETFRPSQPRGATIKYAVFLCVASVLFVSGVAYLGSEYRPDLTAWHEGVEIDHTAVGSIIRDPSNTLNKSETNSITKVEIGADNTRTYRVYQLPKGLVSEK